MTAGQPPNLLVVLADQHREGAWSGAGADHLNTPALDQLAAEGTRHTRAYTTFPLCVPARTSMLTGRHPHELGVHGNRTELPSAGADPSSLGHRLRRLGYRTGYAGKWHASGPSVSAPDGFDVVAPFGDRGLVTAAEEWIRARAGETGPFALVVSIDDPHTICEYARRQPLPYGEVGPPPPVEQRPPLPPNHLPAPYEPEAIRVEQDRAAAMYGTAGYRFDDWRAYRWAYARLIERVDGYLGRLRRTLADCGLADDTAVVYTSDHGDGDAAHAWNQKTVLFEETCRVPLLVHDPRRRDAPAVSDELVSVGLDLMPLLLRLADPDAPQRPGTTRDTPEPGRGRSQVVVQTEFQRPAGAGTRGRSLITRDHKYTVYSWGAYREQLFDLRRDPGETRNLAVEATFAPLLDELRTRLLQWCRDHDDHTFAKFLALPPGTPAHVAADIFAVPY